MECSEGFTAEQILELAALSARWENNDAIDKAITGAFGNQSLLSAYNIRKTIPFNPVEKRTTAWVTDENGRELVLTKGAPQVICISNCSETDPDSKECTFQSYLAYNLLIASLHKFALCLNLIHLNH